MPRRFRANAAATIALASVAACSVLAPSDAELRGARAPSDAGAGGAPDRDALLDDGPADGATEPAYGELTRPASWSTFDTSTLLSGARMYAGGAFDGTYVYFAPAEGSFVARHDTRMAMDAPDSWTLFDTKTVHDEAADFFGAAFDGRYVYFVPYGNAHPRHVARFDTQGSFVSDASWASFDITQLAPEAHGYAGATFDGRYLYFVPRRNEFEFATSLVARFDTQADFTAPQSWSTFNVEVLDITANGFTGAVFDGRYVTFVPYDNQLPESVTVRYDTQGTFESQSAWDSFALAKVAPALGGFLGGAFDGRYVYFAPTRPESAGRVVRSDTQGSFAAAWSSFDVLALVPGASGFAGAAFDGRHVYFVPFNNGADHGMVVRYDTALAFASNEAWGAFDVTSVSPSAKGFHGAVFDGQHVYFVPNTGSTFARFDARSPPAPPALPAAFGSFL